MAIPPTFLERAIGARIHLRMFGRYVGTGHHFMSGRTHDTDDEASTDEE